MGCPYCGGEIPPKPPGVRGRQRRFCSRTCQHNYFSMMYSRRQRGKPSEPELCKVCGKVIMYHRHNYCSDYCQERDRVLTHHDYQIAGINMLRLAVLRQAKHDGALARWSRTPSFYKMFPEITPDMMRKGEAI